MIFFVLKFVVIVNCLVVIELIVIVVIFVLDLIILVFKFVIGVNVMFNCWGEIKLIFIEFCCFEFIMIELV